MNKLTISALVPKQSPRSGRPRKNLEGVTIPVPKKKFYQTMHLPKKGKMQSIRCCVANKKNHNADIFPKYNELSTKKTLR